MGHPTYKTTMRLTITNVDEEDENSYKCVAKNPRGESEGTIRLYCEYSQKVVLEFIIIVIVTSGVSVTESRFFVVPFRCFERVSSRRVFIVKERSRDINHISVIFGVVVIPTESGS